MMTRAFHLSILFFIKPCSSQVLHPHKMLQKLLSLNDNRNRPVSSEDSLSLYVDISEAKKQRARDDFHMRIFNKDKNITVCEGRMIDYVDTGKFPCQFRAADVGLRHGANHFQFEVYSDLNGKRYASRIIPDIHLFDQYIHDGYYDNLYVPSQANAYKTRFALAALLALLAAYTIDTGYTAIASELGRVASFITKLPRLELSNAVTNSVRGVYAASTHGIKFISATAVTSSLKLVASVSSGFSASTNASKNTYSASKAFFATSIASIASYLSALSSMIGASGLLKGALSDEVLTALQFFSHGLQTISNVMVTSAQLVYDILLAGVSSPINMIMSVLLVSVSHMLRLFGQSKNEVDAQDHKHNYPDAKGPPPGPEYKKSAKTDPVSRKKSDDTNGFLSFHPTTYSYNSSSIPTKVAGALLAKRAVPLLIMAVPVQSTVSGVHETPHRSIIRRFFRTACLCLTILALAPISGFDRYSAQSILSSIQGGEVFKNLKLKFNAVGASISQLLDNWSTRSGESTGFAATPDIGPVRVFVGRDSPQTRRGCPFLKKSKS